MNNLGDRVKRFRKAYGWSQKQLGVRLGLSQPSVKRIEDGGGTTQLLKLATVLGVSVEYLMSDGPIPPPSDGLTTIAGNRNSRSELTHPTAGPRVMKTCAFVAGEYVQPQDYTGPALYAPPLTRQPSDAFAVVCLGDGIDPAIEAGQAMILSASAGVVIGDLCVVETAGVWRLAVFEGDAKTGGQMFRDRLTKKRFTETGTIVYNALAIFNESQIREGRES